MKVKNVVDKIKFGTEIVFKENGKIIDTHILPIKDNIYENRTITVIQAIDKNKIEIWMKPQIR